MKFSHPALAWLLEEENPSVRHLALRDLLCLQADDTRLIEAKRNAYRDGAIPDVLNTMQPDGYWVRPGPGYNPKYSSLVWSLILLSQLGAKAKDDERIGKACAYYLDHAFTEDWTFTSNGTPSGSVYCLHGNMCAALTALGVEDKRLDMAYEKMAMNVLGLSKRYYAYTCGPEFACGINAKKPCAWGGVKFLLAFGNVPPVKRTPLIKKAIENGASFMFSVDPVTANYPTRTDSKPNRAWWKFGFPVFYVTDLLQLAEALVSTGYGRDPRLKNTLDYIAGRQDKDGRWILEYDYAGKTWGNYGKKKEPNKWVTYRALKVLKAAAFNGYT